MARQPTALKPTDTTLRALSQPEIVLVAFYRASFPNAFRFFGHQEVQRRHVSNAVPPLLAEVTVRALIPLVHLPDESSQF